MQFAINWSSEASELLEARTIQVDMFKCPDWDDVVSPAQAQLPSYVHFPLQIGTQQHLTWDFDDIEKWLNNTATRFVNCHITPKIEAHPADISYDALIPELSTQVQRLVDAFGAERVIIENCPYFAGNVEKGYLRHSTNPQLFHDIIAETKCGFLLDMSHQVLVCDYLGWSFEEAISALPTAHIREFHVTGIGTRLTGVIGDHMPMTERDWAHLDFCVAQFESGKWQLPEVFAFEYGGIGMLRDLCGSDRDVIAEQVPRFYEIVQGLNHSVTMLQ